MAVRSLKIAPVNGRDAVLLFGRKIEGSPGTTVAVQTKEMAPAGVTLLLQC